MSQTQSRGWNAKLFLAALVAAVAVTLATMRIIERGYENQVHQTQRQNLRIAREFTPVIEGHLSHDERFALISVGAYTVENGMLGISGHVASRADLAALQDAVRQTKPPLPVHYRVEIWDEVAGHVEY